MGLNDDDWKKHIIESAGEIIRGEIGEKKEQRDFYPDLSDIGNIEKQFDYVPPLLRYFFEVIFKVERLICKQQ